MSGPSCLTMWVGAAQPGRTCLCLRWGFSGRCVSRRRGVITGQDRWPGPPPPVGGKGVRVRKYACGDMAALVSLTRGPAPQYWPA